MDGRSQPCNIDTSKDCRPANSYTAHPRAVAARIVLERYLRAPHDAYRHFTPEGCDTTHDIEERPERHTRDGTRRIPGRQFHQARIDAINIASNLVNNTNGCFVHAEHIASQHYRVQWHIDFSKQTIHKRSDHSIIRLTYRTSHTPMPKRTPTFASEIMHSAQGRNMLRQMARRVLTEDGTHSTNPEITQERLVQAWMQISNDYRKEQQGMIRQRAAKASRKIEQFIKRRNEAIGTAALRAAQVQLKRAKREYEAALAARQLLQDQRRQQYDLEQEQDTTAQVHKKIAPRQRAQPVKEARMSTGMTDENGQEIAKLVTQNEEIHQAFYQYWARIVNMQQDGEKAAAAESLFCES